MGRLSLSVCCENGLELGLKTVSFYHFLQMQSIKAVLGNKERIKEQKLETAQ